MQIHLRILVVNVFVIISYYTKTAALLQYYMYIIFPNIFGLNSFLFLSKRQKTNY